MNIKVCDRCGERIVEDCGRVDASFTPPSPHSIDKEIIIHDMELCESCSYELFDTFKFLKDKIKKENK